MLYRLLQANIDLIKCSAVVSLTPIGPVGDSILRLGVPIQCFRFDKKLYWPLSLIRLIIFVAINRPRVVIGWMYHSCLVSLVVRSCIKSRVIWNIRTGLTDYKHWPFHRKLILRFCAQLSNIPSVVLFNSLRSKSEHCAYGFKGKIMEVIYNPLPAMYYATKPKNSRRALRIDATCLVLGFVGRNHPVKRTVDLLEICLKLRGIGLDCRVLYVGRGFDDRQFKRHIVQFRLVDFVHIIGEVENPSTYLDAIDIFVNCSESEGFPNAVAEAALSTIPIVSTNVSDLALGFLSSHQIFEVGDTNGAVSAILRIFNMSHFDRAVLVEAQYRYFYKEMKPEVTCQRFIDIINGDQV